MPLRTPTCLLRFKIFISHGTKAGDHYSCIYCEFSKFLGPWLFLKMVMQKDSKAFLRRLYQSKRDLLTSLVRREKSYIILERLLNLPEFQRAKLCLFYASFRSEVETDQLITAAFKNKKRIALPITYQSSKRLLISEIKNGMDELIVSSYGIREPVFREENSVLADEIDLFIVPGVAFDSSGVRLGYGGGYYDRFLSLVCTKPIFGLAFEVQIASSLPYEKSDIKVRKIITEARVIDCTKVLMDTGKSRT